MAYDLDQGDIWRLRGASPWSEQFLKGLAALMDEVTIEQIQARKRSRVSSNEFDQVTQVRRVTAFIEDILSMQHSATKQSRSVP